MRFVLFYHSLVSDWNHGNAHFLRGVVSELLGRGHEVAVYEPRDGWSRRNLVEQHGRAALEAYETVYPGLSSTTYELDALDLDVILDQADVVIVHEWNESELVGRIGKHRAGGGRYVLLFHDTHHRTATAPQEIRGYRLDAYDGILAFGEVIRQAYVQHGWARRAFTWHEAADTNVFHPRPCHGPRRDIVWIGNWGDDERSQELRHFLIEPVSELGASATLHGVRYPAHALTLLKRRNIEYGGWVPNHEVPEVFSRFRATVHIPRRPYVEALPGIPTIRVFEALACGIPLVCSPWNDAEGLFRTGEDFLIAHTGEQMRSHLSSLLNDAQRAAELVRSGLETITNGHTCAHRVDELFGIIDQIDKGSDMRATTRKLPEART